MNNWYLLLLAFVAVIQPIASLSERNLVDGRKQCIDHRADLIHDSGFYGTRKLSPNRKNYHSENHNERHYVKEESVFTRPLSSRLLDHQERDISRGVHAQIARVNRNSDYRKSERQYRGERDIIRKSNSHRDFSRAERGEYSRRVLRDTETPVARYDNRFSRRASMDRDTQESRIPILARRQVKQLRDNSDVTRESTIRNMRERNDVTRSNDARRARENFDEFRQVRARLVRETRDERVKENYRVSTLKRVAENVQTRKDSRGTRDERQRINIRDNRDVDRAERREQNRDMSDESRRNSRERFSPVTNENRGRNRESRSESRLSQERQSQERGILNMKAELRHISQERQLRELTRNFRSETRFHSRELKSIRGMRQNRERASDRSQTDQRDERSLERLVNQGLDHGREMKARLNHFRDAEGRHSLRNQVRQLELNSNEVRNSRAQFNTRERFSRLHERENTQSMDRFLKRQSYELRSKRNNRESERTRSFNRNDREIRILERDSHAAREESTLPRFNQNLATGNTRVEIIHPETRKEKSRESEIRSLDNLASARREHKLADQRRVINSELVTRSRSKNSVQANDIRLVRAERNMERVIKYSRFLVDSNQRSSPRVNDSFTEGESSMNLHYLFYALQGLYICGVLLQIKTSDNGKKSRSFNMWPAISSFKTMKVD